MKVKCLLAVLLLSATATAFAQEAKYGIKSAILKKEAVTMGCLLYTSPSPRDRG